MDTEFMVKEILEETADLFKENASIAKNRLDVWADRIFQLQAEKAVSKNPERIRQLEISEQYAWNAIFSLKAQSEKIIHDESWIFAEKILRTIKRVVLL